MSETYRARAGILREAHEKLVLRAALSDGTVTVRFNLDPDLSVFSVVSWSAVLSLWCLRYSLIPGAFVELCIRCHAESILLFELHTDDRPRVLESLDLHLHVSFS